MFCSGNVRDRLFLGVSDIVHIARTTSFPLHSFYSRSSNRASDGGKLLLFFYFCFSFVKVEVLYFTLM